MAVYEALQHYFVITVLEVEQVFLISHHQHALIIFFSSIPTALAKDVNH